MAFYKIKKVWKLKDNKVTPENFYNTRRDFLKKLIQISPKNLNKAILLSGS